MKKRLSLRFVRGVTLRALVASVLLSSCWLPMFDPETSVSEALARRLGSPVASFRLTNISEDMARDARFVPERADLATSPLYGLLYHAEDDRLLCSTLYWSGETGYVSYSQEYDNAFGDLPYFAASPDGTNYAYGICQHSTTVLCSLDSGSIVTDASYIAANDGLLGAGSALKADTYTDVAALCYIYAGNPVYTSISGYPGGAVPPDFSIAYTGTLSFPSLGYVTTPGTFFDMGTYLYLSCGLSDGTYAIFRWESATASTVAPVRYPAAYGPLMAALSDGRLLACDGQVTTVLSADMEKLFSFPSGILRFVHERWDGIDDICVFTRTVFVRDSGGDDKGTARIDVYEIPTADLSSLSS